MYTFDLPINAARAIESLEPAALAIRPFQPVEPLWEDLIREDRSSCIYHSRRWISLLEHTHRLKMFLATLTLDGEVTAGCVFARAGNVLPRRYVALPFSDYCPPLAKSSNARAAFLRLLSHKSNRSYEVRGADTPDSAWQTVRCFNRWSIDCSLNRSQLYRNLASNFRRNVVRAQRLGVDVESGSSQTDLQRFRSLHETTRRRLGLPVQPSRFFRSLYALYNHSGDLQIWTASRDGRDLASILALREDRTLYYKWSARADGDINGAGHLLLWSLIENCSARFDSLDMGRADKRNLGLSRYKHEAGAFPEPLPYSFIPRAPREISAEAPSLSHKLTARLLRHVPNRLYRLISDLAYGYLI